MNIISKIQTEKGTSNPWATCSTDRFEMQILSDLNAKQIYDKLHQSELSVQKGAPMEYKIHFLGETKRGQHLESVQGGKKLYKCVYSRTIYYN